MNVSRNCKLNMKYTILNENVAFRLRFPISILLAIIVSVVLKDVKSINNKYLAHGFIPFVVFLLILFIIDISVRATISKDKLKTAELKCDNLSLRPNKYIIDSGGENVRLDTRFNENVELTENFLDKQVNESEEVSNITDYVRHDENKLSNNGLANIIPNSEYSNEIPSNDTNSSATDIDKYATINQNIGNDNKNSYSQSIKELCGKKGCCLLDNKCGQQCPGEPNTCNVVVPVPGPQLQVHRASVVQHRLQNGIYTSSKCPLTN